MFTLDSYKAEPDAPNLIGQNSHHAILNLRPNIGILVYSHLWILKSATSSDLPAGVSEMTNLAWLRFRDGYRDVSSLNTELGQLQCLQLEPKQSFVQLVENNFSLTMLTGLRAFHYEWQGNITDPALVPRAAEVQSQLPSIHYLILNDNYAFGKITFFSIYNLPVISQTT